MVRTSFVLFFFLTSIIIKAQTFTFPKNEEVKQRAGYYYNFNNERKVSNWIGYTLTREDVVGTEPSLVIFHKDSSESKCAKGTDYGNHSFALGTLKPRSSARNSRLEMKAVHNMLNVVPMNRELCRGSWRILDNMIAGWAVIFDSLYVVTGPVFNAQDSRVVGDYKVNVPDKLFKVVLVKNGLDLGAIAFLIPNNETGNAINQYSMSVDSLESITGYDFFSELPEYLEVFIEEKVNIGMWKDLSVSYKIKSTRITEGRCIAAQKSGERCTMSTECITLNCWKHGCDLKQKK